MRFLKKKQVLTKKTRENCRVNSLATFFQNVCKNVAKLLTLPWPSYWPYNFDQKNQKSKCQNHQKPIFIVFLSSKEKQQNSPKKKQSLWHMQTITCLVKNTWKYFPPFWGVYFFGLCFLALPNLTTWQHKKHNNTNNKTRKINKKQKPAQEQQKTIAIGATTKTMEQTNARRTTRRRK